MCAGWGVAIELDGTEMLQSPILPAIRICGLFQRDGEPQGQYGVEAAKEVSTVVAGSDRVNVHQICASLCGIEKVNCELFIVRIEIKLTQVRIVEGHPRVFELTIAGWNANREKATIPP